MKRIAILFCCFLPLLLCACTQDSTGENIREQLTLPLEFDCTFSLGETEGSAHLCLTEQALSLGITDGVLAGVLISTDAEHTRFLYEGMDVTFSAGTTRMFSLIREAFLFLQTQTFNPNTATDAADEQVYTFTSGENTLLYSVDRNTFAPVALTIQSGEEVLTLRRS